MDARNEIGSYSVLGSWPDLQTAQGQPRSAFGRKVPPNELVSLLQERKLNSAVCDYSVQPKVTQTFMCDEFTLFCSEVLQSDPNTKRFKRTLIYFNTDTQYANFRGNPLYQATKTHLNNR